MFAGMRDAMGLCSAILVLALAGCQAGPAGSPVRQPRPVVTQVTPTSSADLAEGSPPEILPDTHLAAGRLHESEGKLARAAEQYRLAIGARPDHFEAYNRLGVVLDRLGKYAEADQAFLRAIQIAPRQAYLHNNLAFSYTMQGRWPEARAALEKALSLEPDFPRARVNLGMVLAQQGEYEKALEQFRLVLQPEDAYYNLGLMYQSKKRAVEAAQAFQQALAMNPKLAAARKRLELLPAEAIEEAARRGELFARPVALAANAAVPAVPAEPAPAEPSADEPPAPCLDPVDAPDQAEFAAGLSIASEPGWMLRDLLPHAVGCETPCEDDADVPAPAAGTDDRPSATLSSIERPRIGQWMAMMREWFGPIHRLIIKTTARPSHRRAELGSPMPGVIVEPLPGAFTEPIPTRLIEPLPADLLDPQSR